MPLQQGYVFETNLAATDPLGNTFFSSTYSDNRDFFMEARFVWPDDTSYAGELEAYAYTNIDAARPLQHALFAKTDYAHGIPHNFDLETRTLLTFRIIAAGQPVTPFVPDISTHWSGHTLDGTASFLMGFSIHDALSGASAGTGLLGGQGKTPGSAWDDSIRYQNHLFTLQTNHWYVAKLSTSLRSSGLLRADASETTAVQGFSLAPGAWIEISGGGMFQADASGYLSAAELAPVPELPPLVLLIGGGVFLGSIGRRRARESDLALRRGWQGSPQRP